MRVRFCWFWQEISLLYLFDFEAEDAKRLYLLDRCGCILWNNDRYWSDHQSRTGWLLKLCHSMSIWNFCLNLYKIGVQRCKISLVKFCEFAVSRLVVDVKFFDLGLWRIISTRTWSPGSLTYFRYTTKLYDLVWRHWE